MIEEINNVSLIYSIMFVMITSIFMTIQILRKNYYVCIISSILFFPQMFRFCYIIFKNIYNSINKKLLYKKICQKTKYKDIKDIEKKISDECCICLEVFDQEEDIIFLPCGCLQIYHSMCILNWLKKNMSCPSCRKNFMR